MKPGHWTCHVCGAERPDEAISVYKDSRDLVGANVRYCNDRSKCAEGAVDVADAWLGRLPERTQR